MSRNHKQDKEKQAVKNLLNLDNFVSLDHFALPQDQLWGDKIQNMHVDLVIRNKSQQAQKRRSLKQLVKKQNRSKRQNSNSIQLTNKQSLKNILIKLQSKQITQPLLKQSTEYQTIKQMNSSNHISNEGLTRGYLLSQQRISKNRKLYSKNQQRVNEKKIQLLNNRRNSQENETTLIMNTKVLNTYGQRIKNFLQDHPPQKDNLSMFCNSDSHPSSMRYTSNRTKYSVNKHCFINPVIPNNKNNLQSQKQSIQKKTFQILHEINHSRNFTNKKATHDREVFIVNKGKQNKLAKSGLIIQEKTEMPKTRKYLQNHNFVQSKLAVR